MFSAWKFQDEDTMAGAVEKGVQGVQPHTHFFAPSFVKEQVLSEKFKLTINPHTHILMASTALAMQ